MEQFGLLVKYWVDLNLDMKVEMVDIDKWHDDFFVINPGLNVNKKNVNELVNERESDIVFVIGNVLLMKFKNNNYIINELKNIGEYDENVFNEYVYFVNAAIFAVSLGLLKEDIEKMLLNDKEKYYKCCSVIVNGLIGYDCYNWFRNCNKYLNGVLGIKNMVKMMFGFNNNLLFFNKYFRSEKGGAGNQIPVKFFDLNIYDKGFENVCFFDICFFFICFVLFCFVF